LNQVNSLASAKKFGVEIDVLCRKMEQMGKDPNQDLVLVTFEERLNRYYKERVFELKDARAPVAGAIPAWNTTAFKTALRKS